MLSGWTLILISFAYVGLLFTIAYFGDKAPTPIRHGRHIIYALSLAVYCSSWTFYGAVGSATTNGWSFLATYMGPILVFTFGWRAIAKVIVISKQQNITSISDFISSRYGKSQALAVLVTLIAVFGTIPYIAMQLKAVSISFSAITAGGHASISVGSDTALFVSVLMAVFAILFGTRHIDATEHHNGLVMAVAFESIIKLAAFLAVGLFVTFELLGGIGNTADVVANHINEQDGFSQLFSSSFTVQVVLACAAVICLPRQFQVTIVEAHDTDSLKLARWLFPLYMIALAAFVLPISAAGSMFFTTNAATADTFVLLLPLAAGEYDLTTFAFIGGLSAATSMVIVASIALATMVSNDIVMPLLIRMPWIRLSEKSDLGGLILTVRRITILTLLLLAYFYYRILGDQGSLASFGLLAFVAAMQFLPGIIGGIFWKTGSRHGVLAGLLGGFAVWVYTLLIPTVIEAGLMSPDLLYQGLFGQAWLLPTNLFGLGYLDTLSHGVIWCITINTLFYIVVSHYSKIRLVDRMQASAFVDVYSQDLPQAARHYSHATVGDLQLLAERFLGISRTQHAFTGFALKRKEDPPLPNEKATPELIHFTERLLAGVIGASSARIIIGSTLRGKEMQIGDVVKIVDEASQVLKFNRSLLQSTIENISLGISVVDQQMRLVAWNKPYIEMFDYPEGLICVGRPIEEVFHHNALKGEYGPSSVEDQVKKRLGLMRSARPHRYQRFRPDGTVLDVRGNPLPNGGYVNTYMDITQHKQIEEALRESEQNIRIYTDNVPVLIAYLDPDRRYLFVNKAYADTFGVDRHNIEGVSCSKVLAPGVYEERAPFIREVLAGKRQRFETILPTKHNESTRYAEVTYIPHVGDYGDVLGYFTLYQDITERRLAELALQETNETLELRVKERTHALSVVNKELRKENTVRSLMEDELRQAKGDADDANIDKTRFLASASHDLLQPLNAARLFSSALAQQSHSNETRQLVENLDGSLKAAEELITAILDISKLDAGALEPSLSHFSVAEMLNNLSAEFTAMAKDKHLKFRCAGCDLVVHSDQKLLRRVLQNFLSNAIRYTQDGGILLGCRRRGNHLRFEVWDSGVGIPENKISEIFEEFRRIDNPRHSQVQGLGLGLAITERIARMLNHPLKVRSWPLKGSVFSVDVPLGEETKAQPNKPESRGWIRSKGLNGVRVLVIDNEPKILEGMKALLEGWACEVRTALSSQEAVATIRDYDYIPDIVLADYHLSDVDTGVLALGEISLLLGEFLPAIVITADRTDEVKQEVADAGAQILNKPIKPAALRAMINKTVATVRANKANEHT